MKEISREVTESTVAEPLTGLTRGRVFRRRLAAALEDTRTSDTCHAVCFMDLDHFDQINEEVGYVGGDELLRQLGTRLRESIRQSDTLARPGGDEFALLLEGCPQDMAVKICGGLRQVVEDFDFQWGGKSLSVGVSMGLATITRDSGTVGDVLQAAESACQVAKNMGRGRTYVFQEQDPALHGHQGHADWARRIRQALSETGFELLCQTVKPLKDNGDSGHAELLLRLHDKNEPVSPDAFLPAAQRNHLMPEIDQWVIQHAFALLENDAEEGSDGRYAINVSAQSIGDEYFQDFVVERLERYKLDPAAFCFDIPVKAAVSNLSGTGRFVSRLKELGCSFALDGVGSNLGTLSYLKTIPFDYVKIDGSLIRDMARKPLEYAIVKAIQEIARLMDVRTVAKWVEDEAILERVQSLGIDYAQGYTLGLPIGLQDYLDGKR